MKRARTSVGRLGFHRAPLPVLIAAACAAFASGQARPRVVVENVPFTDSPVEIVGAEVGGELHKFVEGKPREFGASFDAPEDWLRHVTIKIRNKTDKTLLGALLYGWLAAGEDSEAPMGFEVRFGQELDESAFTGRAPRGEPRRLAPGQTADVRWSEEEYAQLTKFLAMKRPVASYRKMRVDLREARFDDGTVWEMGRRFQIDPLDPRKWTPLDRAPTVRGGPPPDMKPGERVVEVSPYKPDSDPDVLAVIEIRVAGQPVTPGRPFPARDDWLRGLSVRVRNTSAKPITSIQFHFSLPEARYHSGGLGFMFQYGRMTAPGERPAPDVRPLLPGEEAELSATDSEYETNRKFVESRSGLTSLSRVQLSSAHVEFADGTKSHVVNPARTRKPAAPAGTR